jgi:integrase
MGREEKRLYTVGPFWLAERAESPFLQIRWYDERAKVTRSKSTRRRTLDDAIPVILAHNEAARAKQRQEPDEALAVALFLQFWKERGKTRRNAATVASSLRIFMAFLDQDEAGMGVAVAGLDKPLFERFVAWREGPHSYSIEWMGKVYAHSSEGVSGEAIQRNLDDVRAALNYAVGKQLPWAPKVPAVALEKRSPPRDVTLTIDQLGAIVAYACYDIEALRWVLGMIATAARPDAVLKWNVGKQWKGEPNLDTHPFGEPKTKKRNAVVPLIPEFVPWLEAWKANQHKPVRSRKRWWRTMRAALGLPENIVPKTIRHTIATQLRSRGVPLDEIAGLLGHTGEHRITAGYAKYDPNRLPHAKQQLSAIWQEVCASAHEWHTNHFRITPAYGQPIEIARKLENV